MRKMLVSDLLIINQSFEIKLLCCNLFAYKICIDLLLVSHMYQKYFLDADDGSDDDDDGQNENLIDNEDADAEKRFCFLYPILTYLIFFQFSFLFFASRVIRELYRFLVGSVSILVVPSWW